ncbi:hypothetical protein KP77_34190 [Jeotgalibacillus alimentarius]|uniref:Uncharacterized protein n=1 Tax=Jeotgalibacillus alimentarius TaxID=135826 RepID=A0A0C2RLZ2_9BACL|nr:hypothetical protein [Jeotgalibacillus alimentarius]KIL42789.1 hypothetical protein KP77_34190 [Jeotgalibacillus alimentarius]
MPVSLPGKISIAVCLLFVFQFIFVFGMIFVNGFGAIVVFLQFTIVTASLGIIFGVLGLRKESGKARLAPVSALMVSGVFVLLFFVTLFGYAGSFGE